MISIFNWIRVFIVLAGIVLSQSCDDRNTEPNRDVYIMAGQSNVRGYARIQHLPKTYRNFKNCSIWIDKKFEQIIPGEMKTSTHPSQFGPEISFCKYMEENTEKETYVIKFWADATGLDPKSSIISFFPSGQETAPTGLIYKKFSKTLSEALSRLEEDNITYKLAGFIWIHGEQDGKTTGPASRYSKNMLSFFNELNREYGIKKTKIVITQTLPNPKSADKVPARDEVRRSIDAGTEMLSQAGYDVELIETSDIETLQDHIHYNFRGQIKLGARIARAFQDETK